MSLGKKEWHERAKDMIEAGEEVLLATKDLDFKAFVVNHEVYKSLINKIKFIGEGAYYLPDLLITMNSEVDWRFLIASSWVLEDSPNFWKLDDQVVWSLIKEVIPPMIFALKLSLQQAQADLNDIPSLKIA